MHKMVKTLSILILSSLLLVGCGTETQTSTKVKNNSNTVESVLKQQTSVSESSVSASIPDNTSIIPSIAPSVSTSELPEASEIASSESTVEYDTVDLDLTELNSQLVYSEVFNIISNPNDYEGKIIKMSGVLSQMVDENDGKIYSACIISDATACCANGIEFTPVKVDLDKLPNPGEEVTVVGRFDNYVIETSEGNYLFYTLADARVE